MKCKGISVTKKVYFNHDGGVDDLVSLFLLLQNGKRSFDRGQYNWC